MRRPGRCGDRGGAAAAGAMSRRTAVSRGGVEAAGWCDGDAAAGAMRWPWWCAGGWGDDAGLFLMMGWAFLSRKGE
jgi:hypothetical protein